jgi:hypothetical protein
MWLVGGAASMGMGIWSMHYIGMLAYHLPVPVFYNTPTVLLSLLAAILASAVALFVVSRNEMGLMRIVVGGVLMGCGIAAMHYVGMEAMRLPAMCHYDRGLVELSVLLAGLPLAGGNQLHELAEAAQRYGDGARHPCHALHGHGRGQFQVFKRPRKPDQLPRNFFDRHREYWWRRLPGSLSRHHDIPG